MLSAQRTGNTMGAEINGADLSQDMNDAAFAAILELFLKHQVVVFRGQRLDPEHFLRFARRFGSPERTCSTSSIIGRIRTFWFCPTSCATANRWGSATAVLI